jgi:uncharacterized protein (DUF433 family)
MDEDKLLERITVNPAIFAGKPIVRGRRLAVEHVLAMLAAGDSIETICQGYPWLEADDVRACLVYARRLVGHERVVPSVTAVREIAPGHVRLGRPARGTDSSRARGDLGR